MQCPSAGFDCPLSFQTATTCCMPCIAHAPTINYILTLLNTLHTIHRYYIQSYILHTIIHITYNHTYYIQFIHITYNKRRSYILHTIIHITYNSYILHTIIHITYNSYILHTIHTYITYILHNTQCNLALFYISPPHHIKTCMSE